jgi:hypothetical protein
MYIFLLETLNFFSFFLVNCRSLILLFRAYKDRQPDLTAELAERTLRLFPATICRSAALDHAQKTISLGRMGALICGIHCA